MKNSFQGQLVLITGGSSGIGLALARLLAREGARVWILARRREALESAFNSLPAVAGLKHGFVAADVSDWNQVQAAARQMMDQAGVPDLLINSAGVAHPGYLMEVPLEAFHELMDINYFGTVHVLRAFVPAMVERHSGHIVNISSAGGFFTGPAYGAYSPSKYAVRALTDVLRVELKPLGIHVSVVFPPDTDTPQLAYEKSFQPVEVQRLYSDSGIGPFRFGTETAESVAAVILRDIKRGRYVILPGTGNRMMYHLTRLLGNYAYDMLDDEWKKARQKTGKS